MARIYKVVKNEWNRYIREVDLPSYQENGWEVDEQLDITIVAGEAPVIVKTKVKVAQ